MTDEFHPYRHWLGFPPDRLPRDYYELFRLERFEPDLKLIAREADIAIAEVRRVRPGPFAAQWAALLDELCTAKACLTDPRRKEAYDARLRSQGTQAGLLAETDMPFPPTPFQAVSPASSPQAGGRTVAGPPSIYADPPPVETAPSPKTAEHRPLAAAVQPLAAAGAGHASTNRGQRPSSVAAPGDLRLNWLDILYRASALGLVVAAVILAGVLISRKDAVRSYLRNSSAWRDVPAGLGTSSDPLARQDTLASQHTTGTIDRPATDSAANPTGTIAVSPTGPTAVNAGPKPAAANAPAGTSSAPSPAIASAVPPPPNAPISAGGDRPTPSGFGGQPLPPAAEVASAPAPPAAEASPPADDRENSGGDTSPAAEDANKASGLSPEFRAAAQGVWRAMAARDLVRARETLNGLAAQVRHPHERACVTALDSLLLHLEEFWRGVTEVTASLRSAEELPIGETMIIVVEADRERIVVRAAGRNRSYGVREMPSALVRAIVEQRFQKGPDTQILLGAFLAVDPKGDPAEARRLWQAAQGAGADVDLLMQALAYAPDGGSAQSASRLPIPGDGGEPARARQWVESQFPAAYQGTPSIPDKAEAARKMLEAARDAALNDEAVRYLLLREAARLAVESGEARLALQSVEELGARYAVDVAEERRTLAASLAQLRVPASLHQRIASELLEAAQAALAAEDRGTAQALASTAAVSARKARNAALLRQALALLQSAGGNP